MKTDRTYLADTNVSAYKNAFNQIIMKESIEAAKPEIEENVIFKNLSTSKNGTEIIFESTQTHKEEVLVSFSDKVPQYIIEKVMELIRYEEITLL